MKRGSRGGRPRPPVDFPHVNLIYKLLLSLRLLPCGKRHPLTAAVSLCRFATSPSHCEGVCPHQREDIVRSLCMQSPNILSNGSSSKKGGIATRRTRPPLRTHPPLRTRPPLRTHPPPRTRPTHAPDAPARHALPHRSHCAFPHFFVHRNLLTLRQGFLLHLVYKF